jgi:hypothetical protein
MADQREGADGPRRSPANKDRTQSGGREANAAQPSNAARERGGPERYPSVDQTDAIEPAGPAGEPRSFDPSADAPTQRYAGDGLPASTSDGRLGPQGDPAEGRR